MPDALTLALARRSSLGTCSLGRHDTLRPLQILFQGLNLCMIVFSALMIWKGLMVVTGSESPIVVVLRCGMAPCDAAVLGARTGMSHHSVVQLHRACTGGFV